MDVDYYLPGCPPEPPQIWAVLQVIVGALLEGKPLPPKGSMVGHTDVAVCEECPLEKSEKTIARFYRPYEIIPEPGVCLLEQGLVCNGPATVGGCGALCPQVGMGCRGCYGPMPGVEDQGGKNALSDCLRDWCRGSRHGRSTKSSNKLKMSLIPSQTPLELSTASAWHIHCSQRAKVNGNGKGDKPNETNHN